MAAKTATLLSSSPPPSCTLVPQSPLIPGISDNVLAIVLPTLVYAIAGGFFQILDTSRIFGQYRIHPSEDELKRNHATKWEVFMAVVRYHVMQIAIGLLLDYGKEPAMIGDERCQIYRTVRFISSLRNVIPTVLRVVGLDTKSFGMLIKRTSVTLAQIIAGDSLSGETSLPNPFTDFEFSLAKSVVLFGRPVFQFLVALAVVDTWIYFTHRLCHINRTLYRIVHAQHHRLYVSYAYGAVYAHWLESLFLDVLSFVLAGEIAQLSARQSILFGSFATIKTISDHCGYVFPWDPFRLVNNNGAIFHDLHHQSWGLKHNFSTYTVFWDSLLGTSWEDKVGAEARYKRLHEMTAKRSHNKGKATPVVDRLTEGEVLESKDL